MNAQAQWSLEDWGWRPDVAASWDALTATLPPDAVPARVIAEFQGAYRLAGAGKPEDWNNAWGEVSLALRHDAQSRADYPAVGDWVALTRAPDPKARTVIHAVLPRLSKLSRKAAGEIFIEQILATNIDEVFLITAADQRFSLRRIERFLAAVWASGAQPAIIVSKIDLAKDATAMMARVESVALSVPVMATSVPLDQGWDAMLARLRPGHSYVLMGTSGAGKSTLLNRLMGANVQQTQDVRADDSRGRHTTTHRELFALPNGALMIDTPGLRALQLWDAEGGVDAVFDDIVDLSTQCRFRNCGHETEPGCAVQAAIAAGQLDAKRLENFRKLKREESFAQARHDQATQRARRQQEKTLYKSAKPPPWRGG